MHSRAGCIHHLFEQHAEESPQGVALIHGDDVVTYGELNRRANQLAHMLLQERANWRNAVVGLFADRSVEMVVGILGILKAGAAYLPLNPEYPAERLELLVRDSEIYTVVVPKRLRDQLPASIESIINIPAAGEFPVAENPSVAIDADDLAYVIYTSGSTGIPKGVSLPHRGLCRLMTFARQQMEIKPADRVLQFASFSFDASLWEIFAALASGAALVLGDRDSLLPGPNLHLLLTRHGVTIALLSPSVLSILSSHDLKAIRIIVAGTEKCTAEIVKRWSAGRRFFNAYGPTETTIYSTIYEVDYPSDEAPPIGRAVPGTELFVLDDQLQPVIPGEPGELWIGGDGVGREYLHRPELTAELFQTLTLDGMAHRLYRTGDQVRLRPDGNLEYLGRRDFQVKIRGFRVELREVEAALESHEMVASAAVIDGTDPSGNKELWAYYLCAQNSHNQNGSAAELRDYLATKLPEYMIPSQFVQVDGWPLTANGKLDRRALPVPTRRLPTVRTDVVERSLTPTEAQLAEICRELLDGVSIRPADELAALGFHSLLIAQLTCRVQAAFGVTLTFSDTFAARTVAGLAQKIDELSLDARQLGYEPIGPASRENPIRATFAQERIWFLERLNPACERAYHFQSLFTIEGRLDVPALERALNELVSRHEILRTTFQADADGRPVQIVRPHMPFHVPIEEFTGSEEERLAAAQRLIDREIQQPFDVGRQPPIYWRLYRIHPRKHLLLHHEHHFLHDGWSYGVFLRELSALYAAYRDGRSASLPPPPIQYGDFAAWQRRQLEIGAYETQLAYWDKKLAGLAEPSRLPADHTTKSHDTFRGQQLQSVLDEATYAHLRAACQRENVTPYTWLLAAFQTFFQRYTGQHDVCVGTGFAARRPRELESMLGMVLNTVAIRSDFGGAPTFRDMLHRLRTTVHEAADNQDAPFGQVIERLNPNRPGGDAKLFNTFFDSYDLPFPEFAEDLQVTAHHGLNNGSAKFDLVALVIPRSRIAAEAPHSRAVVESATILWEYATDRFTSSTAERMLQHFRIVLEASLAHPETPLAKLNMASPQEQQRIAEFGRPMASRKITELTVLDLFERHAAKRPEAIAIDGGHQCLTYGELNARANQLAAHLQTLGVRQETMVGICAGRGMPLFVGLLGILKAGGAYVPLDPDYPPERLAQMLRETNAPVLLTENHLVDRLPAAGHTVVCLDCDAHKLAAQPSHNPVHETRPENLAYVIFTSGSTGEPKGTKIPHSGIVRLVHQPGYVELGPEEVMLQFAPISFDASTFEIWGALANGARLAVFPAHVPSLTELAEFVQRRRVTTMWLTAALFHQMVEHHLEVLTGVRQLLAGGDVLSVPHVQRTLAALPAGHCLINGYGPTENTTFTCCHVMDASSQIGRSVPIGRPIAGTFVYILDEQLQPVPIGVPGELYIGGEGLALEYLNRPQLTADRFIANPFAGDPDSRLYKSGDQCRWLEDGTIEFLGRRDRQVKIRGFRVELGEVEAMLSRHPAVSEAVAILRNDSAGDERLFAYVVQHENSAVSGSDLLKFVANRLPSYMQPQAIISVDAIPLGANGKPDHAKLPAQKSDHSLEKSARLPATADERRICEIWRRVLNVGELGADDNFFHLGGHSLLAMQVVSRLRDEYGVNIPLRSFFQSPTIAGLTELVLAARLQTRNASPDDEGPLALAHEEGEL